MLFNSVQFLLFFPVVCLFYFLIPQKVKNLWLLLASYYFYMCWNPKYALLMLASTLITWVSGLLIADDDVRARLPSLTEKRVVAISFLSNLGILFLFKYFNFFAANLNRLFSLMHIGVRTPAFDVLLPVGISFYTFQALSYTVDVYRKEIEPEKNFFQYALFVSFFPQLVAGPIERSKNLLKQINVPHRFDFENMRYGLIQMLYGYFQKLVISETAALVVSTVYGNYREYGGLMVIVGTVMFALQIYGDFGGYSNIARGAARVMGFSIMENFHNPYFATSVADFWHRWHISLSTWFRDYLYIPLGGGQNGKRRKHLNLMIVFLTSGLWHGANWTYVVWGGLNGLFQIAGELTMSVRDRLIYIFHIDRSVFSHRLIKCIITFVMIDFTWLFFRATSIGTAFDMIRHVIFHLRPLRISDLFHIGISGKQWISYGLSLAILFTVDMIKEQGKDAISLICRQGIWFRWIIYFCLLYYVLIFGIYGAQYDASSFLYFQF